MATGSLVAGPDPGGPQPRAAEGAAAQAAPATVQIYGRPGSFGDMPGVLPSGQNVGMNGVPGWEFAPGRMAWLTTRAADGTIFMGGLDHNLNLIFHTGDETVIGAFDPAANGFTNINIATSCTLVASTTCARTTAATAPTGHPAGVEIADVQAIADGNAVAFTTWPYGGQDITDDGVWPAFGILTKGSNGWRVAEGPLGSDGQPTWTNQWTGAELHQSNPGGDADEAACPLGDPVNPPDQSSCLNLNEMSLLPQSQDLVIAQYFGAEESSAVAILDVTGPDAAGRYQAAVKASVTLPPIPNYATPAPTDFLDLAPIATASDPSSTLGDERFTVTFDIYQDTDTDDDGTADVHRQPSVAIEYSYDATTGTVTPVTAPLLPPDGLNDGGGFVGWGGMQYDHNGTLWIARNTGFCGLGICLGGNMAVFPEVNGQRRIQSDAACRYNGGSLANYTTTLSGKTVWGAPCRPNYDILQPSSFWAPLLVEDPPNGIVAIESLRGRMFAIRSSGSGTNMTFEVANPVDPPLAFLPGADGLRQPVLGAVDPQHRLWFPVGARTEQTATGDDCFPPLPGQTEPTCLRAPRQVVDQWLLSVDLDDLYSAPATRLTGFNGIQAEQAQTTSTHQRTGTTADVEVDSDAFYSPCGGVCADDFWFPGDGFLLRDDSGFPHLHNPVDYEVEVPTAGNYRIWYRAATLPGLSNSIIRAQVGSATVDTPVTEGQWGNVQSDPIFFPAGTYNITLSVPPGADAWYLSWMIIQQE